MLGNHLLEFNNASPLEFGLLKGWSQDIGTWTFEQKQEFVNWDNNLPDEHIGDFAPPTGPPAATSLDYSYFSKCWTSAKWFMMVGFLLILPKLT